MKSTAIRTAALAGVLSLALVPAAPGRALADTASTAAIAAAAAAIVGAIIYDSNNHPYYVRDGHRFYITQEQAQWYRNHHHVQERRAWVPENEYPVAPGHEYHEDHR